MDRLRTGDEQIVNDKIRPDSLKLRVQNVVQTVEYPPILGEGAHQIPVTHTAQTIPGHKGQFGPDAACVLEPYFMDRACFVRVLKEGGLGFGGVVDFRAVPYRQSHRILTGERLGAALTLDKGKCPVVAIVGDSQPQLFRWNFC